MIFCSARAQLCMPRCLTGEREKRSRLWLCVVDGMSGNQRNSVFNRVNIMHVGTGAEYVGTRTQVFATFLMGCMKTFRKDRSHTTL